MADPIITMPTVPQLGIPTGMKEAGQRVDFRPDQFDLMIETKGYLLAWIRACVCPCTPVVSQTEQPDPNCDLCHGQGWFYFGGNTTQDFSDWELTDLQKNIIADNNAMVIRGIITGISASQDPVDKLGNWVSGTMMLTVRHQNKLGYYDKIIALDSEIAYSEVIEADGTNYLSARYLMTGINQLRSESTIYTADADYRLLGSGRIEWLITAPTSGTRLAIHYLCNPTWLVIEHPHIIRTTSRKFKTTAPKTPQGDPRSLPIQALMRYDFLPEPE
jgi:hypothetical protein